MINADQLLALLGHNADDSVVEQVLLDLHTRRRAELDRTDGDAFTDFVLIRRQGVEFGFVDKVYYEAGPPNRRRRKGVPLVLYQVYLYTEREDITTFKGTLPLGLQWSDGRKSARQKLAQFEASRRSYIRDAWTLPSFHLVLEYKGRRGTLNSVLCELPMHPWPEAGRVQPSLGVADWLALFGLPISSPILNERLSPLDLAKILRQGGDMHEIDFRYECGLQMTFTQARHLKLKKSSVTRRAELVLGMVNFLRSRERDAREWKGELPCQLSFHDTPVTIVEKVGRSPDQQEDEQLVGFAFWHLEGYDLHVEYSTVENYLTEIAIMAPGYST